jgi:hypothetical protein
MFDSSLIGIPVYHSEIKLADSLPALRNAQESGIDFSVRLLAENAYAKTAGWAIQSKNSRRRSRRQSNCAIIKSEQTSLKIINIT